MSLGDTVTYYWTGKLAGTTASFLTGTVDVTGNDLNPPKPLVVTIPKAEVDSLVGGTVEVYYTVDTFTRALLKPSATLVLSVAGAIILPAPTVDYVADGALDPVDAPTGTNVRVATNYPGATKGDIVRVLWNGNGAANSYSNSFAVTPGVEIVCPIAVQYITGNVNFEVTATYQVERTGENTRYAEPLVFRVGSAQAFAIDPTPVNLIGSESYTRNATGGTPPYSYTSNAPGIVVVPDVSNGDIKGVTDGNATITARDSAQGQGSYAVNVTGNKPFTIDTSHVSLTGTQSYTREATGGTKPYTYTSNNGGVVSVPNASEGNIRGVYPGSATITVRDAVNHSGSYPVTVAADFTIDPSTMELNVGGSEQRQAAGGTPPYIYSSGNMAIAAVNAATGVVTGKAPGTTTIGAKDGADPAHSGSYSVDVASPLQIAGPARVEVGAGFKCTATGGLAPYTFASSDPSVARMTDNAGSGVGVLAGRCTITATDRSGGAASHSLEVFALPLVVMPAPTIFNVRPGQVHTLQAVGGTPPYRWFVAISPEGIQLSTTVGATVSATATASFLGSTVELNDALGQRNWCVLVTRAS